MDMTCSLISTLWLLCVEYHAGNDKICCGCSSIWAYRVWHSLEELVRLLIHNNFEQTDQYQLSITFVNSDVEIGNLIIIQWDIIRYINHF